MCSIDRVDLTQCTYALCFGSGRSFTNAMVAEVKCVVNRQVEGQARQETGGVAANFKFAVARVGKNGQTLLTLIFISHMLQCC